MKAVEKENKQIGASFILVARPAAGKSRILIRAGKRLGNAVKRNRAKRIIREIARGYIEKLPPDTEIVLIARNNLLHNQFHSSSLELANLFKKARCFVQLNGA